MKLNMLKEFRKDEEGGILAFFLVMFLALVVGGGMAVDFMNSEYQREKVQDALDRGVLAATAVGQGARAVTPSEIAAAEAQSVLIVKSYLQGAGYDPDAAGVLITPEFTLNSQSVAARAAFEVDTFFLRLSGIDTLGGNAAAGAFVAQTDIEISLVLDVSGSMGFDGGGKIINLRNAGSSFVGSMLSGDRAEYTFISVIPFNHSVNIGANILGRFSNQQWHNYSGCATFTADAMRSAAMSPNSGLEQTGHLQRNYLCNAGQAIVYSNNAVELQAMIGGLEDGGATAGFTGMKWAMALLDPSAQPIVTSLIADGLVSETLAGKPAAYDDEDGALKFIIFMSDGTMNRAYQFRPHEYAVEEDDDGDLLPANSLQNAIYWDVEGGGVQYESKGPVGSAPLLSACTAAKEEGVIVFSIAYGLIPGSNEDEVLADCASTNGHYYNVDTDDLDEAFASIEATVHRLRLTN